MTRRSRRSPVSSDLGQLGVEPRVDPAQRDTLERFVDPLTRFVEHMKIYDDREEHILSGGPSDAVWPGSEVPENQSQQRSAKDKLDRGGKPQYDKSGDRNSIAVRDPELAPLYCYAISAKRYALFNKAPDGDPPYARPLGTVLATSCRLTRTLRISRTRQGYLCGREDFWRG